VLMPPTAPNPGGGFETKPSPHSVCNPPPDRRAGSWGWKNDNSGRRKCVKVTAGERVGGKAGERVGGKAGERVGGKAGERVGGSASQRVANATRWRFRSGLPSRMCG